MSNIEKAAQGAFASQADWDWDECLYCGTSVGIDRGLVSLSSGLLARVAWCSKSRCQVDRVGIPHLLVRDDLASLIDATSATRRRRQTTGADHMSDFQIVNGWLTEQADEHTCGTGDGGYYGAHEPGCGTVPLVQLRTLDGWADLEAEIKAEALRDVEGLRQERDNALAVLETIVKAFESLGQAIDSHADQIHPRKDQT